MAVPGRIHLLVWLLGFILSACATAPTGPLEETRRLPSPEILRPGASPPPVIVSRAVSRPAAPLRETLQRNQEEARRLEADGRLAETLERWRIVLTIDPENAEARRKAQDLEARIKERFQQHLAAGKERLQQRDKQGSQREFLAALRLDPLNREAIEQLYQSDEQLGEQTAFARPLPATSSQAKVDRGRVGEAKSPGAGDPQEAEESGEEVSLAEATEIFRRGDYLAAIDAFTRVLALRPGMREAIDYQKQAYYNQGVAYMDSNHYVDALRMFDQVRKLQPDFKRLVSYTQTAREKVAEQHNLAGIRNFREKKLKEAIQEWDQALTLNPKLESAKRSRDRAVRLLKNLEEVK